MFEFNIIWYTEERRSHKHTPTQRNDSPSGTLVRYIFGPSFLPFILQHQLHIFPACQTQKNSRSYMLYKIFNLKFWDATNNNIVSYVNF